MIKAIFFDFNGVIIDDETIQMKAYQEVLRGHDINLLEEWYFGALGMDDRTFVRSMFAKAGKPLTDATAGVGAVREDGDSSRDDQGRAAVVSRRADVS